MKAVKFSITVLPCFLFVMLFGVYWLLYVIPLNKLEDLGLRIPDIYWNQVLVIFLILLIVRVVNFISIGKEQKLLEYFRKDVLIWNIIIAVFGLSVLTLFWFFMKLFGPLKHNVSLHMIIILFISLFSVKTIVERNKYLKGLQ